MHWALAAILFLRALMPGGMPLSTYAQVGSPLGTNSAVCSPSGSPEDACICCPPDACPCIAPAPAAPTPSQDPAAPPHNTPRPVVIAVEPTTEMTIGWLDTSARPVATFFSHLPAHATLGSNAQAALCIWRT
ncbi:MAG: hypothetical protein KF902_05320 [Phycisphaeraceae bacterium]|nr:hypothetical protein [Phycisphaeraceae bacterium]